MKVCPCQNPFCTDRHDRPGAQQSFTTGATRSADDNKIDYEGHLNPEVLHFYGDYMNKHRVLSDGQRRASDNWQLGIPAHKYVKSLVRHGIDLWRAWRGTTTYNPDTGQAQTLGELCAAVLFNVQGLLSVLMQAGATENYHIARHDREAVEQGKPLEVKSQQTGKIEKALTAEDAFKKISQAVSKHRDALNAVEESQPTPAPIWEEIREAQRRYEEALKKTRPFDYGKLLYGDEDNRMLKRVGRIDNVGEDGETIYMGNFDRIVGRERY